MNWNSLINLLKGLLLLVIKIAVPLLLVFFLLFGFYKVPIRWFLKKMGDKKEIEKLQRLLTINREHSTIAAVRESILDIIFKKHLFVNPVEHFESPPLPMNRSQWIEEQLISLKRELLYMGVPVWKIKCFQ